MRVACCTMVLGLACCFRALAGDGKDDLKALQGEWVMLYYEDGSASKFVPVAPESISVKGHTWVLKRGGRVETGSFTVAPKEHPRAIDITFSATGEYPEVTRLGRYEIDGDRLRICYPGEDDKRPESLSPVPKSGQQCYVYRRKVAQNAAKAAKELPKELRDLQGRWSIVSQEVGGEQETLPDLPKGLKLSVVIKGNVLAYEAVFTIGGAGVTVPDDEGTITINAKSDPKEIDLAETDEVTKKTEKILGIYRIEGDTLKICFAGDGEKARPMAFATKKGTTQTLMILKREK